MGFVDVLSHELGHTRRLRVRGGVRLSLSLSLDYQQLPEFLGVCFAFDEAGYELRGREREGKLLLHMSVVHAFAGW